MMAEQFFGEPNLEHRDMLASVDGALADTPVPRALLLVVMPRALPPAPACRPAVGPGSTPSDGPKPEGRPRSDRGFPRPRPGDSSPRCDGIRRPP
jgi:hypothetical protein